MNIHRQSTSQKSIPENDTVSRYLQKNTEAELNQPKKKKCSFKIKNFYLKIMKLHNT